MVLFHFQSFCNTNELFTNLYHTDIHWAQLLYTNTLSRELEIVRYISKIFKSELVFCCVPDCNLPSASKLNWCAASQILRFHVLAFSNFVLIYRRPMGMAYEGQWLSRGQIYSSEASPPGAS